MSCPFKKHVTVKEWEEMKARLEELERRCPHCGAAEGYMHHKDCYTLKYPEPEQWKPEPVYFSFDSIFEHTQAQWMEEKITRYANQLQWLFKHYPEQNGEWCDVEWCGSQVNWHLKLNGSFWIVTQSPTKILGTIYMSEWFIAKRLADEINSGKVRF